MTTFPSSSLCPSLTLPMLLILSGKSVEEIKSKKTNKELAEFLKVTRERNDASSSSTASLPPGSQIQSKSSTPIPEMSTSRGFSKQHGSKNSPNSNLRNRTPFNSDEFKYGFPSDGLSTASNKWWGGTSVLDGEHNLHDVQERSKEKMFCAESRLVGKSDTRVGTGLLTAVRERAVKEGRALGVYRYGVAKKLGRKERALLLGIFKSSLPSPCGTWF